MRVVCGPEMLCLAWGYLNLRLGTEEMEERDDAGAEYRSIILIKRITPNRRTRREEAR
jgi:hypothetical protein